MIRQFRVTHVATGQRTYVMAPYDGGTCGSSCHRHAAVVAGYTCADYFAHRVRVELVRNGFERKLAFDVVPLVVRVRVAAA